MLTKHFIAVSLFVLTGCASMYTQQKIENSAMLNPGMTKEQAQNTMGLPVKTEFSGNLTAWHYCKTGESSDEFVVIVFSDDKLIKMKSYAVTSHDVGGAFGDCSKFVRPYEFDVADGIKEIRIKEVPNH
jgi:outer membrane protein assembly factor BamE (lipoprotein component of BamABCDE complex)